MCNHQRKLLVSYGLLVLFVFSIQGVYALQDTDTTAQSKLRGLAAKFKKRAIAQKDAAIRKAHTYGWTITEELTHGGFRELKRVGPEGNPLYYESYNDMVIKSTRSDFLSAKQLFDIGIDGTDMVLGLWDSGKPLADHQEFGGRVIAMDNGKRISGHATHVMGTAIASGVEAEAKGVAHNATGHTFDWNKDEGEAAEAAADGLLVSNHSYGLSGANLPDWYFGSYSTQAQDWDEIMHAAPYYLMVTAAGNFRHRGYNDEPLVGTAEDGYDLLLGFAVSKNGLTVAAADDIVLDNNGGLLSASIAGFSNYGPADDGRIKPDITGAGVNIYSSYADATDSYKTLSGTSMASPGVAASLLLLQQYHQVAFGSYMRSSTLKGLALHTADEAGDHPGPDAQFGWGIMNSKRAAQVIDQEGLYSIIEEVNLNSGETYTMTVKALPGQELRASLSWTDPAHPEKIHGNTNASTPVLVHDLDLRINSDSTAYYPWKLSLSDIEGGAQQGDNKVDPFERIDITNANGEYTITVSHKGELANSGQVFSLIISGVEVTGCDMEVPELLEVAEITPNQATLSWSEVTEAFYELQYRQEGSDDWNSELVSEPLFALDSLQEATSYEVRVRSLCTEIKGSEFGELMSFTTPELPEDPIEEDPIEEDPIEEDPQDPVAELPGDPLNPDDPASDLPGDDIGNGKHDFLDDDLSESGGQDYPDSGYEEDTLSPESLMLVYNGDGTLSFTGPVHGLRSYYIADMSGKVILQGAQAQEPIPVNGLSAGIYVLVYEFLGHQQARKFAL